MTPALKRLFHLVTAPFRLPGQGIRALIRRLRGWWRRLWEALTAEPEERPLPDAIQQAVEQPQTLWEHFNALRKHLLRAAAFWVLATAGAFVVTPQLIAFLARPIGGLEHLQAIEVTEPLTVFVRVALLAGFAVALPYIYFELYLFAAPGLRPRARLLGLLAMPLVLLFFVGGMAFAYYVMLPAALPFLLNFLGIPTVPRPASYIRFVTGLLFWIGVAFEFPLVIYLLAAVGWVRADQLARHWRVAVVAIAVLAAAVTPTVDPVNMLLVMAPMTVLYLFSIFLARLAQH